MTPAERQRRRRERLKPQQPAAEAHMNDSHDYPCPYCGHSESWRNGHHGGKKCLMRRLCPKCGRSFTVGGPIIGHRPPIGERAMTPAERQRRYRERLKQRLAQQAAAVE